MLLYKMIVLLLMAFIGIANADTNCSIALLNTSHTNYQVECINVTQEKLNETLSEISLAPQRVNITSLIIQDVVLESIPFELCGYINSITNLQRLRVQNISGNATDFPCELETTQLHSLAIINNENLSTISDNVIKQVNALGHLALSGNAFPDVSETYKVIATAAQGDVLNAFSSLSVLDLSSSNITRIAPLLTYIVKYSPYIKVLLLDGNTITDASEEQFNMLKDLELLEMGPYGDFCWVVGTLGVTCGSTITEESDGLSANDIAVIVTCSIIGIVFVGWAYYIWRKYYRDTTNSTKWFLLSDML